MIRRRAMTLPAEAAELVESLRAVRAQFGARPRRLKLDLLGRLAKQRVTSRRLLCGFRDVLHFLLAYPDDAEVREAAEQALRSVASASQTLASSPRRAEALVNSGLAGSFIEAPFSLRKAAWLAARYPGDVELAWEDESAGKALDDFLGHCVPPAARDGLLDETLTAQAWMRLARGDAGGGDLAWLLERIGSLDAPPEILDRLYEALELDVRWRIGEEAAAPRLPPRPIFYDAGGLQRECDVAALLRLELPATRPLPRAAALRLIDVARTTLALRQRETDPVTYANPAEVTLVRLERGVDVALFGMEPARRLPIESFFGYVAARNTIPVAYGGGWVFGDRCEIGINVLEPFRGGESALLFGQILRVYHRHYRVRKFLVDPFQFGAGNREGISSGAFWFYYRLGFRPVQERLARLAADEWSAIRSDRNRRTASATLRRLAAAKLALEVARLEGPEAPDIVAVALAVTRLVGQRFGGEYAAAARWAMRRAVRVLEAGDPRSWPPDERRAFEGLVLLAALIPDLDTWPAPDRRRLASLLRAKGGTRERDYTLKVQSHARLQAALRGLVL